MITHAPSVQIHEAPPDDSRKEPSDEENPDVRVSQNDEDKKIEAANEFYDGEKDNDGDSNVE